MGEAKHDALHSSWIERLADFGTRHWRSAFGQDFLRLRELCKTLSGRDRLCYGGNANAL